jgi:hypothetical protein
MNKTLFHKLPRARPPWLIQAEEVEEQTLKQVNEGIGCVSGERYGELLDAAEAAKLWAEDCRDAWKRGETPASLLEAKWS